eukprot:ANDGO_06702.mRNA.1 Alpha-protein kinase 1
MGSPLKLRKLHSTTIVFSDPKSPSGRKIPPAHVVDSYVYPITSPRKLAELHKLSCSSNDVDRSLSSSRGANVLSSTKSASLGKSVASHDHLGSMAVLDDGSNDDTVQYHRKPPHWQIAKHAADAYLHRLDVLKNSVSSGEEPSDDASRTVKALATPRRYQPDRTSSSVIPDSQSFAQSPLADHHETQVRTPRPPLTSRGNEAAASSSRSPRIPKDLSSAHSSYRDNESLGTLAPPARRQPTVASVVIERLKTSHSTLSDRRKTGILRELGLSPRVQQQVQPKPPPPPISALSDIHQEHYDSQKIQAYHTVPLAGENTTSPKQQDSQKRWSGTDSSSEQLAMAATPLLPTIEKAARPVSASSSSSSSTAAARSRPTSSRSSKWTEAIRYEYIVQSDGWRKSRVRVFIENAPFARGTLRESYRCRQQGYKQSDMFSSHAANSTGPGSNDWPLVAKRIFQANLDEERERYFEAVKTQACARYWAARFNKHHPPKQIGFLPCWVIECVSEMHRPLYCIEPKLDNRHFEKHNSNYGSVNREHLRNTHQAFSHFTWEASGHQLLICDLQGEGDLYTDPQIHSMTGHGFGDGNLGPRGILAFLKTHECNSICDGLSLPKVVRDWVPAHAEARPRVEGYTKFSLNDVDTHRSRPDYVQFETARNDERKEALYRLRMLERLLASESATIPAAGRVRRTESPDSSADNESVCSGTTGLRRSDSMSSEMLKARMVASAHAQHEDTVGPAYNHIMAYLEKRRKRDEAKKHRPERPGDSTFRLTASATRAIRDFEDTSNKVNEKLHLLDETIAAAHERLHSNG